MTKLQRIAAEYIAMENPPSGTVKELSRRHGVNYYSLHTRIGEHRVKFARTTTNKRKSDGRSSTGK